MASLISTIFTLIGMLLSGLLFIANKIRILPAVIYFLLIITVLNPWAAKNEMIAWIILIVLLAVSLISWIITGVKKLLELKSDHDYEKHFADDLRWQLSKAREMGYQDHDLSIDSQGNVIVKSTGKPIIY